jgi:hypothetical protein
MPSGLAYKVYRRRAPSSAKLSTGTNDPPERPSPTLPPERSEPSALGTTSAKTVTRRVRTERHDHSRSCGCTCHPGRRDANAATNRRAGSRLPESPAKRRGHSAGLNEPHPRPTDDRAMTSMRAPRSCRAFGPADPSSMARSRRCCHRCARSTSGTAAPSDPTGPNRESSATTSSRFVSYRLDTPAPPTVTRLWHRLVSRNKELSPPIRSPECPADVRSGWNPAVTLPPRSIPTDPAKQETPGTIGT